MFAPEGEKNSLINNEEQGLLDFEHRPAVASTASPTVPLEGVPTPDDDTEPVENKSQDEQNPCSNSSGAIDDVMHRMSDPNDFKGRGVNIHVAPVLGAGCMESPGYFHHIPFVFEITEKSYFNGKISRDPDGMATIVTSELSPFLDILPHVSIIVEMNPRHLSPRHGFTNRLPRKGNDMTIPRVGILDE
jgi:hypothetical protein